MGWIDDRKYVAKLISDADYVSNEWTLNQELLFAYRDFLRRWGDSQVSIVKRVEEETEVLEALIPQQKDGVDTRDNFSLSTYLATIPFPRSESNVKLRNILLNAYDARSDDALERFCREVRLMFPPQTYEQLEETKAIFKGVELALKKGFMGDELRRRGRENLEYQVTELMKTYASN